MENKEVSAKIDSFGSQVKELTHLVAALWENQNPFSSTQKPQASPKTSFQESYVSFRLSLISFINGTFLLFTAYFILVNPNF